MSLPVVLRDEAQEEFDAAFDWYEAKRPGLGVEFAAQVQRVFDRIAAYPEMHGFALSDIRKGVVRRFPYCVLYRAHPDSVEVIAVFHTSRNPSVWQMRSREEKKP